MRLNSIFSPRLFIFFSFLILFIITAERYQNLITTEDRIIERTTELIKKDINKKIKNVEEELDKKFNGDEISINKLANEIDKNHINLKEIPKKLTTLLEGSNYHSIAVHFSEDFNSEKLRDNLKKYQVNTSNKKVLYAPFASQRNGISVEAFPYDYTNTNIGKNTDWYSELIKKPEWYGPYFGSANNDFLISYRAPIKWNEKDKKNKGIVIADYSLQSVHNILKDIRLLESGYIIILNESGKIIYHPVKEYLSKNLSSVKSLSLDIKTVKNMMSDTFYNSRDLTPKNINQSREKIIYKHHINSRDWNLLVVLNRDEALTSIDENSVEASHSKFESKINKLRSYTFIFLGLTIFTGMLFIFWSSSYIYWIGSISFSLLCIVCITDIWLHNTSSNKSNNENVIVSNKTDLAAALNTFRQVKEINKNNPHLISDNDTTILIPTGIFIKSVKFSSSNNLFVTGYIWQKLPKEWENKDSCKTSVSNCLGFTLPEAETINRQIIYQDKNMARWKFEASIRQEFNYSKYPFDEENISLHFQTNDVIKNEVILVPDFDSYPSFEDKNLAGLKENIFIEGWEISKTSYSFQFNKEFSTYGEKIPVTALNSHPDLYFNINIKRQILGASVAYALPITVISFLLFAVLVMRTTDSDLNKHLGFNASSVLTYSASLFFVLVISHMSLRESLNAKGIIYLEYFFFNIYLAIAAVSVSSIIFNFRSFSKRQLSPILLYIYWPALSLSILISTMSRFI